MNAQCPRCKSVNFTTFNPPKDTNDEDGCMYFIDYKENKFILLSCSDCELLFITKE